jgi:hypothetical protein
MAQSWNLHSTVRVGTPFTIYGTVGRTGRASASELLRYVGIKVSSPLTTTARRIAGFRASIWPDKSISSGLRHGKVARDDSAQVRESLQQLLIRDNTDSVSSICISCIIIIIELLKCHDIGMQPTWFRW